MRGSLKVIHAHRSIAPVAPHALYAALREVLARIEILAVTFAARIANQGPQRSAWFVFLMYNGWAAVCCYLVNLAELRFHADASSPAAVAAPPSPPLLPSPSRPCEGADIGANENRYGSFLRSGSGCWMNLWNEMNAMVWRMDSVGLVYSDVPWYFTVLVRCIFPMRWVNFTLSITL